MRISCFHSRGPIVYFYALTTIAFLITLAMLVKEYVKYKQSFQRPKRADVEIRHTDNNAHPRPKINNNAFVNNTLNNKYKHCHKDFLNRTLLIVALGNSYEYEGIPLYELLYKGGFKYRVLCGPSALSNDSDIKIDVVNTRNGAFLYDCLSHCVNKYPDYDGYFFVAEEILANYWNFVPYDKNQIWQDGDVISGPSLYSATKDDWEWWASPWGMRALEKAYEYLIEKNYADLRKSKLEEGDWKPEWDINNALNYWLWNGQGDYKAFWVNKTILYLPKRHVLNYKKLAKIFRQSGVRHAIAMPTIIRMLEIGSNIIKLNGKLINALSNSSIINQRDSLIEASKATDFLFINGGRRQRREVLNDLKLKEFAMGKFLYYDECPG